MNVPIDMTEWVNFPQQLNYIEMGEYKQKRFMYDTSRHAQ